jgi:hypothetical protein
MARQAYASDPVRVELRVSPETVAYLDDLIGVGIHGSNRSEVAKVLVGREIERLIGVGILRLHRSRPRK